MEKLWKFDEFCNSNARKVLEDTEFNQMQFGVPVSQPMGPGFGWAVDPRLSIYGSQDSPYVDYYSRKIGMENDLLSVIDWVYKDDKNLAELKLDFFLEDIEKYENLKILRLNENHQGLLDIFISFDFDQQEYFGVLKDFNKSFTKPILRTGLFENSDYKYIDRNYKLKLGNFIYRTIDKWFVPKKGLYVNLKENNKCKNSFGENIYLKKDAVVEVITSNKNESNIPYIKLKYKNEIYTIENNDYYWFKWRFDNKKPD